MRGKSVGTLLAVLLLGLTPAAGHGAGSLNLRINLDLKGAPAADVLNSCGSLVDGEVVIEPGVEGEVTMTFQHVRVETFLNALCESIGCQWKLEEGEPNVLRFSPVPSVAVSAADDSELERNIDMSLVGAAATDVLTSFAAIVDAEVALDMEFDVDVTIELSRETVAAALDRVCEQLGCQWSLERGSRRILRFSAAAP